MFELLVNVQCDKVKIVKTSILENCDTQAGWAFRNRIRNALQRRAFAQQDRRLPPMPTGINVCEPTIVAYFRVNLKSMREKNLEKSAKTR